MLGVLRGEGDGRGGEAPLSPAPGLDELDALVAQAAGAGVEVQVSLEGRPRRLPAAVDLAAYRVVQESLTNVVRHAAASRAEVTVTRKGRPGGGRSHGRRPRRPLPRRRATAPAPARGSWGCGSGPGPWAAAWRPARGPSGFRVRASLRWRSVSRRVRGGGPPQ